MKHSETQAEIIADLILSLNYHGKRIAAEKYNVYYKFKGKEPSQRPRYIEDAFLSTKVEGKALKKS